MINCIGKKLLPRVVNSVHTLSSILEIWELKRFLAQLPGAVENNNFIFVEG